MVHGDLETLCNTVCRSIEAELSDRQLIWLLVEIDVKSSSPKSQCTIPWENVLVFNTVQPSFNSQVSFVVSYY